MILSSDSKLLVDGFKWALKKAPSFVVTGTKNGAVNKGDGNKWYGPDGAVIDSPTEQWAEPKDYKPSFWAGYYDRTAYYIRDFVHQINGACLLGLYEEIFNMYYTFVSNADEKTGWFAPWAFNFDNSIYYMDTPNYERFVRELTAQFELVEKAYSLYLFTGDKRYIYDDTIFNFISNVMTKLVDSLDGTVLPYKNGIPEGRGDIFQGTSTYNERGFHAAEAGDSIGAMYSAIKAYSEILKLRGNVKESQIQSVRADNLKEYFNNEWSVVEGTDAFAYAVDNFGNKHYEWYKNGTEIHGGASCIFMPLKAVTYSGKRNDALLDYIFKKEFSEETREDNIESLTYLPDLFFLYHQNDRAWYWMKYILSQKDIPHERKSQGLNGDYPEISFTILSQVINGLFGVSVNSATNEISTCPHFPNEINYTNVDNIKFGENDVNITLYKNKAVLKNNGSKMIVWNCKFYNDGKEVSQKVTVNPDETVTLYSGEI